MMKRLPSRNHRSKGIRVKHVLQIALLLGVCFWLIYQVKHNHDKKKEFDESDAKLSARTNADQILKLGRKDLHPGKDEIKQNEKHEEEEEDENIIEDEENKHDHKEEEDEDEGNKHETGESEDNKHEETEQTEEENKLGGEEQDEDENKSEGIEDEGRGGRDDENEIDENDPEKREVDADRDEEIMDEEKEKEEVDETEDENSEDEKREDLVEGHNTHEAREEHYKGDDASSAVAHDAHTTATETETFGLENADVNLEKNITKSENETSYSDESNSNQNDTVLKVTEGELADRTYSNATSGEETGNKSLSSHQVDSSYPNKTVATNSDSNLEERSNLSGAGANTSSSSQENETVISSVTDHVQNATVNTTIAGDVKNVQTEGLGQSGNGVSEENLLDSDSTTAHKTQNRDVAAGESSNLGAGESEDTRRLIKSNETANESRNESIDVSDRDKSKGNSETSETVETQNKDTTEDEMFKGVTQTGEADETSDTSTANGTSDSVEHDVIDSSDDHIHEEVTKFRTDLDTLPDFGNAGEIGDEIAAE